MEPRTARSPTAYFDVLDTVRTAPGRETSESGRAGAQALALLRLHLIAGTARPVMSETQAIDAPVLIDQLTGDDAAPFLELVRDGHLSVRLRRDVPDLRTAMIRRLETGTFIFSAWPELSGDDAEAARRREAAVVALQEGDPHLAGDDVTAERVDALLWFDDSLQGEWLSTPAERLGADFTANLLDAVHGLDDPDDPALTVLMERPPATRSAAYERLGRLEEDGTSVELAREIVDWAYNLTVAVSLDVDEPVLTSRLEAVASGQSRRPRSTAFRFGWFSRDPSRDLVPVGWSEVAAFVAEHGALDVDERTREAEAARFLARARVGYGWEVLPRIDRYADAAGQIATGLEVAGIVPEVSGLASGAAEAIRGTGQLLRGVAERRSRADYERLIRDVRFDRTDLHGVAVCQEHGR